MPAASEAVGSPGGGGGGDGDGELQFQIRNDEGFVFKVPRGLYPDAAPSTTQSAAGPDRKAAGLRRRRRALLRLRDKRLRDLSRWEALASELLAPLQAPQSPASSPVAAADSDAPASTCSAPVAASSSCSAPVAAAASSSTCFLDALLQQVDLQAELMKKLQEWCDDANAVCDAQEAAIIDSVAPRLPAWGCNPFDLMAGLCSPAADRGLDGQNGRPEASGVSSAAAMASPAAAMASPTTAMAVLCCPAAYANLDEQNGRPEASDSSLVAAKKNKKMGHELPPTILTESRMRKRIHNLSGSEASIEPKRKRASRSTSIASGTPGTGTRSKTKLTSARAQFILGSPGALTRRRATTRNESPEL